MKTEKPKTTLRASIHKSGYTDYDTGRYKTTGWLKIYIQTIAGEYSRKHDNLEYTFYCSDGTMSQSGDLKWCPHDASMYEVTAMAKTMQAIVKGMRTAQEKAGDVLSPAQQVTALARLVNAREIFLHDATFEHCDEHGWRNFSSAGSMLWRAEQLLKEQGIVADSK